MVKVIGTSNVPDSQLEALERFTRRIKEPELRHVLLGVSRCIREGVDLVVVDDGAVLTPTEASKRLGMSRTHLYKLLDRGEIVSHRVGRDRRIRLRDLIEFEAQRRRDSLELAERFASQQKTREGAIDELADQL